MAGLTTYGRILLFWLVYLHTTAAQSQCNTDQNPYCAGQSQFESLCCPPGDVCYWSNRNGDPACCPGGTDCRGDGGPGPDFVAFTAVQQTPTLQTTYLVQTVYTTTQPQYSTATYYLTSTPTTTYSPPPQFTSLSTVVTPAVVVVTATNPVVAPVTTNGVYVTVTQVQVVAGASKVEIRNTLLWKVVGATILACGIMFLI